MSQKLGFAAVCSFVIANMIGTGVFTSLGFQLLTINNQWVLLSLWLLGGVLAFFGALIYAELGSVMPRSGGEYHFLSRLFHPGVGFAAGWISITVGFAAPVAATCVALGKYAAGAFDGVSPEGIAVATLVFITLIHSFSISFGGQWQTVVTTIKVLLIILFIGTGLLFVPQPQPFAPAFDWAELGTSSYAVSLVWVMFAYSGWNAATYIIGDIDNPRRTITPALLLSTACVTLLYILLNAVFLYSTPARLLVGQIEIGNIAAISLFGAEGGRLMSGVIALLLVSSISSMVYVGPRVTQTMGQDVRLLRPFAQTTANGTPLRALWMQCLFSLLLIITASFDQIITFSGFVLNLCTLMVAIGLLVHRQRHPHMERPFRTWGYPVTPLVFIGIITWILVYLMIEKPVESLYGVGLVVMGCILYFGDSAMKKRLLLLPLLLLLLCANTGKAETTPAALTSLGANELNQTARLIAGIQTPSDTLYATALATEAWQNYARESDAVWTRYYTKNARMIDWVRTEVHAVSRGVTSLFYPFSGPDFLYANLLFPDAQVITTLGLEKLGKVPTFTDPSSMAAYLEGYKKSINEVLRSSYYRTKEMQSYLNTEEVDGVIPVIMLFMARANMQIAEINFITLDEAGVIVPSSEAEIGKQKNRGVEFKYYAESDPVERRLIYFTLNVQDDVLARNPAGKAFIESIHAQAAFSKSASYLMHHRIFNTVRTTILNTCDLVVSDDSGIAFRYYSPDIWDVQLYGSYAGCIKEFKDLFETDLDAAYKDPQRLIKPLGFRIGYSLKSNMRIAQRKQAALP